MADHRYLPAVKILQIQMTFYFPSLFTVLFGPSLLALLSAASHPTRLITMNLHGAGPGALRSVTVTTRLALAALAAQLLSDCQRHNLNAFHCNALTAWMTVTLPTSAVTVTPASELSSCSSSANRGVTIPNHFRAKLILREHSQWPWSSTLRSWAVTCIMIFFFSSANHWRWPGKVVLLFPTIVLFFFLIFCAHYHQFKLLSFAFIFYYFQYFSCSFWAIFFLFLFHPKDYNPTIILDISFLLFSLFFWY
jgi:hypothetical protein